MNYEDKFFGDADQKLAQNSFVGDKILAEVAENSGVDKDAYLA